MTIYRGSWGLVGDWGFHGDDGHGRYCYGEILSIKGDDGFGDMSGRGDGSGDGAKYGNGFFFL